MPNAEQCTKFWSNSWGIRKEQQRGRMIERSEERERVNDERPQERVSISVQKIKKQCRKIQNWKVLGRGGVQGY